MSDDGDSDGGDSGWATWDEEHPDTGYNSAKSGNSGGGQIGQSPQTGYYTGQQHTMDLAAQHGISTEHITSTSSGGGFSPPPAPTTPTPGVKQGTVPVGYKADANGVAPQKPQKPAKQPAEKTITKPWYKSGPLSGPAFAKVSGGLPGAGVLSANTGGMVK